MKSLILLFLALVFATFLFYIGSGPITWDELNYAMLSWAPAPEAWILNRFIHIYFQKLFFALTGDPLIGMRLFWAIELTGTTMLTYWIARSLASDSSRWEAGALAVLLFLSQRMVFSTPGVTYADYSAMFFTTLCAAMFVCSERLKDLQRRSLKSFALSFGIGLSAFLAMKSKETGLPCLFFMAALLQRPEIEGRRPTFELFGLGVGLAAGQLVLSSLDWIFLGDALFSLRLSSLNALLNYNLSYHSPEQHSFFDSMFKPLGLAVCTLTVFSLMIVNVNDFEQRFALLVMSIFPWLLIALLTVLLAQGQSPEDRYLIPAWPIFCSTAAAGFTHIFCRQASRFGAARMIRSAVLALLVMGLAFHVGARLHWRFDDFYASIVAPLALIVFFGAVAFYRCSMSLFLASTALICLASYPLSQLAALGLHNSYQEFSTKRFYPAIVFKDRLSGYKPGRQILVSGDIQQSLGMFGRNDVSSRSCLTLALKRTFSARDLFFAESLSFANIARLKADFVFLSKRDWERISSTEGADAILQTYDMAIDPAYGLRLLELR